jgi:hypothetical protein
LHQPRDPILLAAAIQTDKTNYLAFEVFALVSGLMINGLANFQINGQERARIMSEYMTQVIGVLMKMLASPWLSCIDLRN